MNIQVEKSEILNRIFVKTRVFLDNPYLGREEECLEHLKLGHRRLIEKHCKIIYKIKNDTIYITDVFDTRQDPKFNERVIIPTM